jgi:dihydrofolate synthase/folylpolyglutamate synthase
METRERSYEGLFLPLPGEHQCENLACAVQTWELLASGHTGLPDARRRLTEAALRKGLASVSWPCRLELVQENPAVVLDGSHNPDGIRRSADWLAGERDRFDQVILVMGMIEGKDRISAAEALDGLISRLIITKPLSERATGWQELAKGFRRIPEENVEYIEDCHEAVRKAVGLAGDTGLVFCTGSFYLVGELRKNWEAALF